MSQNEPFGRQAKPVRITLTGEKLDVEKYLHMIQRYIESRGYDNVLLTAGEDQPFTQSATIYPGAANE